jgi:multidrug resistance efflux pump
MSRKKKIRIAIAVACVVVVFAGTIVALGAFKGPANKDLPTTTVRRGNVELNVYTTGELRPPQTTTITAPSVPGSLTMVTLAGTGAHVEEGDVVVEFDPGEQEYNLEQALSRLAEARQQITNAQANMAVQSAQDKVAQLRAKYDVRRAELEVQKNELVSDIDKKKNLLALDEAQHRQAQLEKDVKSREVANQAGIAVLQQRAAEAEITKMRTEQAIKNMVVRAPMNGLVTVKENRDVMPFGGMILGMTVPEYREGDSVMPGRAIAEVLATEQMEVLSQINEADRSNVTPGQIAEIQVDGRPGVVFKAKVKAVAGIMSRGGGGGRMFLGDNSRRFDTTLTLEQVDPRVRPGVTASIVIRGNQLKDVLYLPRQCLFEKDGKRVIYVRNGGLFEAREIKVKNRTESQIVIEGLKEGDEVALVNPEEKGKAGPKPAAASGPMVGGGGGR